MSSYFRRKNIEMPNQTTALPGRDGALIIEPMHFVHGRPLKGPFAEQMSTLVLGMGCFWGAERLFWSLTGAYTTAVGYAGGFTKNPTYDETCTGMTGHTEVVLTVYDTEACTTNNLLKLFWEKHDPTQGMRQGNDTGTQYRSAIFYTDDDQKSLIEASRADYDERLSASGVDSITTEIARLDTFYYAETYHQQYLAKNPNGYCGLHGTGVHCNL
jgi:peptide-methionine (S)-S-oxide reductase